MTETDNIDYSETETRTRFILPNLIDAGWDSSPFVLREEFPLSAGRIVARYGKAKRDTKKFADYMLRYGDTIPLAIVEAKKYQTDISKAISQVKEYALRLEVPLAYASNGREIIEIDMETGHERYIDSFPAAHEVWERRFKVEPLSDEAIKILTQQSWLEGGKQLRYYQEIAVNSVLKAISEGNNRVLLTMATGTGKTFVAFQICWKLWNAKWNSKDRPNRKPRVLFLADRNILVDDPKDKTFTPFGDARHKITRAEVSQGREMYFALYQSLSGTSEVPALYEQYSRDFFDLVIVDEAHRGSAKDESTWRKVLEHFTPAYQLGLTATPRRDDNIDTYEYFGNPVYEYSLRQGIEDGYLAPYTVHRVITNYDRDGWRPTPGQTDRYGEAIPDREYTSEDFDQIIAITPRTQAIAKHLTQFLKDNGLRYAKTIIFCVDQNHADEMRRALNNENLDLVQKHDDYVVRITSDEGDIGKQALSNFQDPEEITPVIVTTSQLLTTGVDVPTCQNIVLIRPINSMTEFKQIIGRGTRVRDDYDKLYFNILDYAGSATDRFRDPEFDGFPALVRDIDVDEEGNVINDETRDEGDPTEPEVDFDDVLAPDRLVNRRQKFVVDNVEIEVEIVGHAVYEIDSQGNRLNIVRYTDYTAQQVRTLFTDIDSFRNQWADPGLRELLIEQLKGVDIDFRRLADVTNQPEADYFDLLCNLAFDAPLLTRRERAKKVKTEAQEFFTRYSEQAQIILDELLTQYAEYGITEFNLRDVFHIPRFKEFGNRNDIIALFGDAKAMKDAVEEMQRLLYAA